jgi:hypothetical protein
LLADIAALDHLTNRAQWAHRPSRLLESQASTVAQP